MKKDLLIEIGAEEIPAGFLPPALAKWQEAVVRLLEDSRLEHGKAQTFGTPRRLALAVEEVAARQPDAVAERSGPFVAQAFDRDGKATKAAEGFARSCGVEVSALERLATPKGEKLIFRKPVAGKPALEILAAELPELIREIPFPKAMRWGEGDLRFARPIHWILARFGGEVVPFSLDGIESGSATRGHRFTHPQPIEVEDLADYLEALERADVVVDPDERKDSIKIKLRKLADDLGGELYTDLEKDPTLLNEVTWLVECPVAVAGHFDEKFLLLPKEVLIEAMAKHQRYFAVKRRGSEELLNSFITIANTPVKDRSVVAQGNERVLKARLSDAEFFYREDSKVPLEKFAEKLSGVVFQAKLGTYQEKCQRVEALAGWIAEKLYSSDFLSADELVRASEGKLSPQDTSVYKHARRAARLCKADLVTQMVYEFPSLQGMMGGEYARVSGEPSEVAEAIRDHYLPRSAEDIENGNLPEILVGDIVSLADKMDSIVGCWGVGLAPTGSADAFAIRRQTLGVIAILLAKRYPLSIPGLVEQALQELKRKIKLPVEEVQAGVEEFFKDRLRNFLIDSQNRLPMPPRFQPTPLRGPQEKVIQGGYPYDVVDAILGVWNGEVADAYERVKALAELKKREDFEPLMIAFKRVVRIIEGEPGKVDPERFEHETEKALYREFKEIEKTVRRLLQNKASATWLSEMLSEMAKLKPVVDKFFDDVMVNVEDKKLRENRHALLAEIRAMFREFADFSKVVTAG